METAEISLPGNTSKAVKADIFNRRIIGRLKKETFFCSVLLL